VEVEVGAGDVVDRCQQPPVSRDRIALSFAAFNVPCVTYDILKSLITSPLSRMRSPSWAIWCFGWPGQWASAGVATTSAIANAAHKPWIILIGVAACLLSGCLAVGVAGRGRLLGVTSPAIVREQERVSPSAPSSAR
jgi:hypothetical protein